MMWYS